MRAARSRRWAALHHRRARHVGLTAHRMDSALPPPRAPPTRSTAPPSRSRRAGLRRELSGSEMCRPSRWTPLPLPRRTGAAPSRSSASPSILTPEVRHQALRSRRNRCAARRPRVAAAPQWQRWWAMMWTRHPSILSPPGTRSPRGARGTRDPRRTAPGRLRPVVLRKARSSTLAPHLRAIKRERVATAPLRSNASGGRQSTLARPCSPSTSAPVRADRCMLACATTRRSPSRCCRSRTTQPAPLSRKSGSCVSVSAST
mmetsp:Transcript_491/g.1603  ORF Transcript_491/g.1603 Transcript_491/m.1603 type:complete len:259 (-) Transcript_491:1180-1956(-)